MEDPSIDVEWVLLTTGSRSAQLRTAVNSVVDDGVGVTVVYNGCEPDGLDSVRAIALDENLGVPGGRDVGLRATGAPVVGFLDDDAVADPGANERIMETFAGDDRVGAVALRLVDESGRTARRHVPRLGGRRPDRAGDVALFLGGACAIRRDAYLDAGGYFTDLFYGHEELELSWRLVDRGWSIRYVPEVRAFHPRSEIGRHSEGWRMTGRNRVLIARRTLPWVVAGAHVVAWLCLGAVRAPRGHRRAYVSGWRSGWSVPVDRAPIAWRTVWKLTRLGRPPLL